MRLPEDRNKRSTECELDFKSHSISLVFLLFFHPSITLTVVYIADDSWVSILSFLYLFFKAVLKNGVISGSGFMNSGNVRCGNSVCRPISGVFAKNPLPNGYVHVTTIPAGASNITITELRNSINFLGKHRNGLELKSCFNKLNYTDNAEPRGASVTSIIWSNNPLYFVHLICVDGRNVFWFTRRRACKQILIRFRATFTNCSTINIEASQCK